MNEPTQTGNNTPRPATSVIVMILLLIAALVGSTFLFSGTVGPDPIEMFSQTGSPTVQIEMKAASTVAVQGFSTEMADPFGKPLFISDEAGLTNADVKSAGVRQGDGFWFVEVQFTEAGVKKLTKLSTALVVKDRETGTTRLAILLDSELRGAPVVLEPVTEGFAQIQISDLDEAQATRLAKGIVGVE